MKNCHLTTRYGKGISNPSEKDLLKALEELKLKDNEHTDTSLANEDGWSISIYENGLAVLENVETGEGPWHMKNIPNENALKFWKRLQLGELNNIQDNAWSSGYGNA